MKKIEFSKLICGLILAVCGGVALYTIVEYFALVRYAITSGAAIVPDGTVPMTALGTIVGAFVSYCFYQFGLKNSRNKYGIDESGQPYKSSIEYFEVEPDPQDSEVPSVTYATETQEATIPDETPYFPTDRGDEIL